MCLGIFACMLYVCVPRRHLVSHDLRRGCQSGPLGLELEAVVKGHVTAGNGTLVLGANAVIKQ